MLKLSIVGILSVFALLLINMELPTCISEGRIWVKKNEATEGALKDIYAQSIRQKLHNLSYDEFISSPTFDYYTRRQSYWFPPSAQVPGFYVTHAILDNPLHSKGSIMTYIIASNKCAVVVDQYSGDSGLPARAEFYRGKSIYGDDK